VGLLLGAAREGPESRQLLGREVARTFGQAAEFILICWGFGFLLEEIIFLSHELSPRKFCSRGFGVQDLFDADFAFGG
jgi:hypothetical protein